MVIEKIYFPQWENILNLIYTEKKTYSSSIVKQLGLQYSYVNVVVHALERKGLLNLDQKSRIKYITLTKVGKEIGALINKVKSKMREQELKLD